MEKGPGLEFFTALKERVGDVKIIAEDLGFLTDSVRELQKEIGYPGMKILEFAFGAWDDSAYVCRTNMKKTVWFTREPMIMIRSSDGMVTCRRQIKISCITI